MGSITTTTQDSDSVELSRNAKGQYSWVAKVYGQDRRVILDRIAEINQRLLETYGKDGQAAE